MKSDHAGLIPTQIFSNQRLTMRSTRLDRWALRRLHHALSSVPLRLKLWDGFELTSAAAAAVATITIKNRAALLGWLRRPDLEFGEAYMSGAIELDGDLLSALEGVYRAPATAWKSIQWWPSSNSNGVRRAKENVHHHYDLGNEFYRLWLDPEMVYTCAYFPRPDSTLEEAQMAKMDLVCRKLYLQPGERVVEAGCGWGALALFMAKRYGATVRAFNISAEQISYGRWCAAKQGLSDRVEFVEDDYRNVSGQFDVFVSIGMLEHVGLRQYADFGRVITRSLTASGRGLLHFIGRNRPMPLNRWIRKRIFPGGYPPTLREVFVRVLEPHDLSVLDVENLRLHYAKTLDHWRRRFLAARHQVCDMFDESFARAWLLYLAGSQAAFSTGWMQLFQVLFTRGANNEIPWTRERRRAFS